MLRVPVYAQEAEERMVEVEYPARGTADCRGHNDARGAGGLQLRRSPRGSATAFRAAETTRRQIPQAARGLGELRKISAGLSADDGRVGGQREEGRDAHQAAGEIDRVFGAQRAHRIHVIRLASCSHTLTAIASGVPRPSIKRK